MTTTERDRSIVPAQPPLIPEGLLAALGADWWDDAVMLGGWSTGAAAFAEGVPAGILVTRLASLEDRALELALQDVGNGEVVPLETALQAVRRVREASTLLHEAALHAFSHEALRALQADARAVRHELRNPIGTIRNALSLLREGSDEHLAHGDRADAPDRLHAIAVRGTSTIERLVRERLSGAAAVDVFLGRGISLGALVERSVRALSGRARAIGVVLAVGDAGRPNGLLTRAIGVDLVLRSTLVAAVRAAAFGTRVEVEPQHADGGGCSIRVRSEQVAGDAAEVLDGARELAGLAGLSLTGSLGGEGVCVESGAPERSVAQ